MTPAGIEMGRLWAGSETSLQQLLRRMDQITPQVVAMVEEQRRSADDGKDTGSSEPSSRLSTRVGSIGVVRISGSLVNGGDPFWNSWLGVVGYDEIRNAVLEFALDQQVTSILLDIDSGGGQVHGMSDVADLVGSVDEHVKPVFAHSGGNMCSAAYYVGCSARRVTASSMADVGSIGVLIVQRSVNRALKENGVDVEVIRAGEFKALGNPFEELSDKARKVLQESCDYTYDLFLGHVAARRNVTTGYAKSTMGEGRVFTGQQAVEVGLVDEITSFDAALQASVVAKKIDFLQHETRHQSADTTMTTKINPLLAAAREAALKKAQEADAAAAEAAEAAEAAAAAAVSETDEGETPGLEAQAETPEQPAGEQAEVVRLQAKVELLTAQAAEANKALLAEQVKSAGLAAKLEQAAEGHAGLRAIAASAVQHLNIALGRSGGTMANASDEQIVADHARLSEEFDANFKAGGVAVTSAKAEAAQVDPAKAGRLKAARLH